MNNVTRFKKVMNFEKADRLPIIEWAGWWGDTLRTWHQQGLPDEMSDGLNLWKYFGLDCFRQLWIKPRSHNCPAPDYHGASLIKDEKQYENFKKYLFPKEAFDKDLYRNWADEHKKGDAVLWLTLEGFFWFPRTLLGIEGHLFSFSDQPELIHRINRDLLDFNLRMIEEICEICEPNFMTFAEDMSYNQGPMFSKSIFNEFLSPYYHKIIPELKNRGIITIIDSDGDVTEMLPWLIEVGIQGILPLERNSGVDIIQLREDYPDLRIIGAFDKTVMHLGQNAIRDEFERLLPVMKQGGFIPSVDHRTPPDVSLKQYRDYLSLLKEYAELAMILN